MATERDYQGLYDRIAALRDQVTSRLASDLITNPQLADALTKQIDDMLQGVVDADTKAPPPPDKGLAELAGIGPQAAKDFGQTRIPPGVEPYDETIPSERIIAVGDVYYIYVSGRAFSRKWRPPVPFQTSFPSPAAMSRRTARRLLQKGGVRGSDWPFARRKNEQNPCFGR
jgi:hypothetical protein